MVELPKSFRKNGYTFRLVCTQRIGPEMPRFTCHAAIYALIATTGRVVAYEVMKVRFRGEVTTPSGITPPGLWLPSNEDWGTYGWTYVRQEVAERKYAEIISQSFAS